MKEIGGECMYCTVPVCYQQSSSNQAFIECQHKIYQTLPLAFEPTTSITKLANYHCATQVAFYTLHLAQIIKKARAYLKLLMKM